MGPEAPPATHVSDLEVPPRVRPAGTATQHHPFAVVAGLRTGERGRAVFPGIEGTRSHVSNSEVARWIRGTRQWPARCRPRGKLRYLRRRRADAVACVPGRRPETHVSDLEVASEVWPAVRETSHHRFADVETAVGGRARAISVLGHQRR